MLHMGIKGNKNCSCLEVEWESLPRPQATCVRDMLCSPSGLTECGRWQEAPRGRLWWPWPRGPTASVAIVTGSTWPHPSPWLLQTHRRPFYSGLQVSHSCHGLTAVVRWLLELSLVLPYLLSQKIFTLPALIVYWLSPCPLQDTLRDIQCQAS